MPTLQERIKERRSALGLTLAQIANMLGVQEATVQRYESGEIKNIKHDTVLNLSKILECTPAYLMGWEEVSRPDFDISTVSNVFPIKKTKKIPLIGTIACGQPILAEEHIEEYIDLDELVDAKFALRCKGDSMVDAGIYNGDIVFIRDQPMVENGEIAAVIIEDGADIASATLKKVYLRKDSITLRACNPTCDDIEIYREEMNNVRIIGKAVAFLRQL